MSKKTSQLGIRLDKELFSRLKNLEKITGIPSATITRMLIEAAVEYYEKEKQIVFPICLTSKKPVEAAQKNTSPRPPQSLLDHMI